MAKRHSRRLPCRHLLAPTVRVGAGARDVSSSESLDGRAQNRRTQRADTAWCLGCPVAPSHRHRPAMHSSTVIGSLPLPIGL
jgi:hypothetical protein